MGTVFGGQAGDEIDGGNDADHVEGFDNNVGKPGLSALGIKNCNRLLNVSNAVDIRTDSVLSNLENAGGDGSVYVTGIKFSELNGSDFFFRTAPFARKFGVAAPCAMAYSSRVDP